MYRLGLPQRHSIRLKGYDYTQAGAYFVTICTENKECLFGEVQEGIMHLNSWGEVVYTCWESLPEHFPTLALDAFVIMPNHIHGVVVIETSSERPPQQTELQEGFRRPVAGSLATIVRSYKAAVTKQLNILRDSPGVPFWQRNYYEHIIRNEESLFQIRTYITNNPAAWEQDENHPNHPSGL